LGAKRNMGNDPNQKKSRTYMVLKKNSASFLRDPDRWGERSGMIWPGKALITSTRSTGKGFRDWVFRPCAKRQTEVGQEACLWG